MNAVLLVWTESKIPAEWIRALERNSFSPRHCANERDLLQSPEGNPDLILVRLVDGYAQLPGVLRRLREQFIAPVILIQPKESADLASAARTWGLSDYLREPISAEELVASLKACLAETRSAKALAPASGLLGGERLIGNSAAIKEVRGQITRIAASDCNVLITGETGTGKELAAELIHSNSNRSHGRFVCVNCAAIPEALFESELFGYERGAFTGAHSMRPGQLELADKGVLFLDEIGEMNVHAQAKILRAIDGKEIQRLGRQTGVKVNVRIVCATNRNLESEVEKGTFRADLFFRLNVARLKLPPLRERKEDLHGLGAHFLRDLNEKMSLSVCDFTEHSWRSLLHHSWPGNVREFKNVVEASLVRLPYHGMRLAELPEEFHRQFEGASAVSTESEKLLTALVCHNWNKSKAAQELRWSRMTLYRKMVKYQLATAGSRGSKTA